MPSGPEALLALSSFTISITVFISMVRRENRGVAGVFDVVECEWFEGDEKSGCVGGGEETVGDGESGTFLWDFSKAFFPTFAKY